MTAKTNHYCDRLDLPVPRLEEFVGKRGIKLFDLMVVALLEHGAPLSSELLAARLTAVGVEAATGDMAYSLLKAWHGMEPVYRDAEGRWGLNLSSSELKYRLFRLELRGARTTPVAAEPEPAPDPIPDDVPLTEAEVRWALADRSLYDMSLLRQAAAVLDAVEQAHGHGGSERVLVEPIPAPAGNHRRVRSRLANALRAARRGGEAVAGPDGRGCSRHAACRAQVGGPRSTERDTQ